MLSPNETNWHLYSPSNHQFRWPNWHNKGQPLFHRLDPLFLCLVFRSWLKAPVLMPFGEMHCSDEVQHVENSFSEIPHALLNGTEALKRRALLARQMLLLSALGPSEAISSSRTNQNKHTQPRPIGGLAVVWLCSEPALRLCGRLEVP